MYLMIKRLLIIALLGYNIPLPDDVSANNEILKKINVVSDIKRDENLVFFKTSAWLDESGNSWMVPIHGWVYEPQDSRLRKSSVEKVLEKTYGLSVNAANNDIFSERINLLLADNERSKKVVVRLAGKTYSLPSSAANGHFSTTLRIPISDIEGVDDDMIRFTAILDSKDDRTFEGEILLLDPYGTSVISDIDDTVKLTYVTERKKLIEATFFNNFSVVDGMNSLYGEWHKQGVSIHFVSSSPWQLYLPLEKFLVAYDFPWATMSLKSIRFRDETILDIFKKGTETKPVAIESILQSYPNRQFILVGDSGEQDAEVYAQIAEKYPDQISKIFIRSVSVNSSLNKNYQEIFSNIDTNKWKVFVSTDELN